MTHHPTTWTIRLNDGTLRRNCSVRDRRFSNSVEVYLVPLREYEEMANRRAKVIESLHDAGILFQTDIQEADPYSVGDEVVRGNNEMLRAIDRAFGIVTDDG